MHVLFSYFNFQIPHITICILNARKQRKRKIYHINLSLAEWKPVRYGVASGSRLGWVYKGMPNILTALPHSGRYLAINITYHSIFYIQSQFWDQGWHCAPSLYSWWPFDPEVGGGGGGLANFVGTDYLFSPRAWLIY